MMGSNHGGTTAANVSGESLRAGGLYQVHDRRVPTGNGWQASHKPQDLRKIFDDARVALREFFGRKGNDHDTAFVSVDKVGGQVRATVFWSSDRDAALVMPGITLEVSRKQFERQDNSQFGFPFDSPLSDDHRLRSSTIAHALGGAIADVAAGPDIYVAVPVPTAPRNRAEGAGSHFADR